MGSIGAAGDDFERLSSALPATIGIAIAAPGRGADSLGRWSSGAAWSTIKVPLAVAALRADRQRAEPLAVKAITESDNASSERLWSHLGQPVTAAQRVQEAIAEAGDAATVVESQRLRAGFTPFGQTQWTLAQQAVFAANMSRIPEAAVVIDLMGRLIPEHRWGLAARNFAAKGGWGPGTGDTYLVRQFGIVSDLGVALAAEARSLQSGLVVIDAMTDWLFERPGLADE